MRIEDYFEFETGGPTPVEIKIKGHRILIEHVLYEYLLRDMTLEELVERFDTLTKEEILAVLLYYHHNKVAMDRYMNDWLEWCRKAEAENRREHAARYERIRHAFADVKEEQRKKAAI
jgi:uncharacterized protein (DUF433 family)